MCLPTLSVSLFAMNSLNLFLAAFMSETVDFPTPNSEAMSTAFSPFSNLSKILNLVGISSTIRFLLIPLVAMIDVTVCNSNE